MLLYIVKQFITHYFVWQKTDLANLLTSSLCFAVHVARVTSHYPTGHFTPKGGVKISFGNGGSLGWVLLSPTRSKNADFRVWSHDRSSEWRLRRERGSQEGRRSFSEGGSPSDDL